MTDRYLSKISPRHQQIARLFVGGNSQSDIARLLKIHKSTVSRNLKDPLVIQAIKRLQEMADINVITSVPGIPEKLQEGAHKGIEALIEILDDERNDPDILKLKVNITVEVLDRVGYGPIKQVDVKQASVSYQLTPEELEAFKKRGLKAARESGLILEGDDI